MGKNEAEPSPPSFVRFPSCPAQQTTRPNNHSLAPLSVLGTTLPALWQKCFGRSSPTLDRNSFWCPRCRCDRRFARRYFFPAFDGKQSDSNLKSITSTGWRRRCCRVTFARPHFILRAWEYVVRAFSFFFARDDTSVYFRGGIWSHPAADFVCFVYLRQFAVTACENLYLLKSSLHFFFFFCVLELFVYNCVLRL